MSLYSVKVSLKLRAGVAQRPIFAKKRLKFNFRSWKCRRIYVVLQLQIESSYISRISW